MKAAAPLWARGFTPRAPQSIFTNKKDICCKLSGRYRRERRWPPDEKVTSREDALFIGRPRMFLSVAILRGYGGSAPAAAALEAAQGFAFGN